MPNLNIFILNSIMKNHMELLIYLNNIFNKNKVNIIISVYKLQIVIKKVNL